MNTTRSARSLANALLHQASRGWDTEVHVIATIQNYAAVRELVVGLVSKAPRPPCRPKHARLWSTVTAADP
jgi:hypothetical protein